jgi:hypothetical protein
MATDADDAEVAIVMCRQQVCAAPCRHHRERSGVYERAESPCLAGKAKAEASDDQRAH